MQWVYTIFCCSLVVLGFVGSGSSKPEPPVTNMDMDPCKSSPCPSGQKCIKDIKQCVTTPCDQFMCMSETPCSLTQCESGYHCTPMEHCQDQQCWTAGRCEKDPGTPTTGAKSCPPLKDTVSTCDFSDCTESGCTGGLMCCPTSCGGTTCQTPV